MYRLGGNDAAMLYAETGAVPMFACTLTVLDQKAAPARLTLTRLRSMMAARIDRVEPFRQRLVTVPLGLDRPMWIDAGEVDVEAHIRAIAVPKPGSAKQVGDVLSDLIALPLPHDRPPWQCWLIEGLQGGLVGLFFKVHHALLGGTRAMALFELLFDLEPDAAMPEPERISAEPSPSPLAVAGHLAWSLAGTPVRIARTAADVSRAAVGVARFAGSGGWRDAVRPFQGPSTSLNGTVDASRACAYTDLSLTDVKLVKRAFGVTVNDVVLAVCGGALRRYLQVREALPERALTASVPVSLPGSAGSGSILGNAVSNFGASLATDVADPVERLRRVAASTKAAKGLLEAGGPQLVLQLAEVLPPGPTAIALRGLSAPALAGHLPPVYNVIVSNLPGPPVPLYSGGARLVATHIFGPLIPGFGLNITVLSYVDRVDVGINACQLLVPDPWSIAGFLKEALAELAAAVPQAA